MFHLKKVLGCLLMVISLSAQAFIDPPVLQPPNPMAGQELSVQIRLGQCDGFTDAPDETDVAIENNIINLLIDGSRRDDPILCMIPIYTATFPFGAYTEGNYTLNVLMRHDPLGPLPVQIDNVGTIDFTVAGAPAPPVPAPTLGVVGIALLILTMLGISSRRNFPMRIARN